MKDNVMSENEVHSLIPFQALTFFVKENCTIGRCYNSLRFFAAIQELGAAWELHSCTFQQVQAHICALYGNTKFRSVNELRADVFEKKYTQKSKLYCKNLGDIDNNNNR